MIDDPNKIKILVVDDSDVIRTSLIDIFSDYQLEVLTCSDGLEGIRIAAEHKPNLIFLDLLMPNFDGIKMLQVKNVLKDIRDIPVVVISANTQRNNVLAAIEAGAYKVISKPLEKEVIISCVNEILGREALVNQVKSKILSKTDQSEIKQRLVKVFLNSFTEKKKKIQNYIKEQNIQDFFSIIHEIKGNGGTMGYPEITDICIEMENRPIKSVSDWVFIEFKCNQLFKTVSEIEAQTLLKSK